MNSNTKRIMFVDYLRFFAALSVIFIHVSDELVNAPNHRGGTAWVIYTFLNILCRYAVPLFILLSGSLADSARPATFKHIIHKYGWMFLCFPLYWLALFFIQPWKQDNSYIAFLRSFFQLQYIHLYFIQAIFLVHIVHSVFPGMVRSLYTFSISKLLVIQTIFFIVYAWLTSLKLGFVFYNFLLAGFLFLPIFLLGMKLQHIKSFTRGERTILAVGLLLYLMLPVLKIRFHAFDKPVALLTHALSPLPTLAAASAYLFAKKWMSRVHNPRVQYLASLTLGVYLIHPLIIAVINRYFLFEIHMIKDHMIFWFGWKIFLISILSFAVSALIRLVRNLFINTYART